MGVRRPDRHGVLRTRRPLRASSTATCLRYVFTTLPTTTTHSTTVRLPLAEGLSGCGAVGLRSLLRSPQPFPLVPLSPALHSFRDSRDSSPPIYVYASIRPPISAPAAR